MRAWVRDTYPDDADQDEREYIDIGADHMESAGIAEDKIFCFRKTGRMCARGTPSYEKAGPYWDEAAEEYDRHVAEEAR